MESSWRWNGWWAEGRQDDCRLVARLVTPVSGRAWMGVGFTGPPYLVFLTNLDAGTWTTGFPVNWFIGRGTFPYGVPVTQEAFMRP